HQTEVWMDSGVRSGQDILRAVALGAQSTMVGRAFLYALGAAGEAGVTRLLELLENELSVTLGFCGLSDIQQADRRILLNPNVFDR
ncbi:MAG TPA: alpha-hydroxy-acid oxidizing protein, partial [Paenalcaligenes sp.]|nr:alpha-hydroxy-acid oxidizing protein [Paenalcaligenes sp.]